MLFRAQVRTAVLDLLTAAAVGAGAKVETSKDTPVQSGAPPAIVVYVDDNKAGIKQAGTEPAFRTTVQITIALRAEGKSKADAETQMDTLCELVENSLLGDPTFTQLFEAIDSVETQTNYDGVTGNRHVFTADIDISAHATERFEPTFATNLTEVHLYLDSVNIFDAEGTYQPPFNYPVAPAPRTTGPDGRVEIEAPITIPTE